ncbi:FAD-dependent monooxygenase [Kitasatospora kifunensis]|uniref:2-polyprenyl-6-methoxyphenol hydroxylase-like FAD-dependent oxidoreductase n=1 Tax=Kitasatospora kifunensis TaxID=58351 RepID=A0A7W7R6D1_KITKI|nr:FAD-dependent monooxygenase [Kitasatospora kifunensis]MBB4926238.1 2-polyprenyl-6-methoxyphenol hydroxylase-like FAD-dependent oxidoreductase [Kitasatospora kifunensis]
MTVLIAGAGIGGLTAALSLHAVGIEALVVESAQSIEPLGVGINLQPHAVRELIELGLAEELAALGVSSTELVYCDPSGNRLFAEPRGTAQGYRWPQYSVHRGELQLMLLAAVRERLGADAVRTGTRLVGFDQDVDQDPGAHDSRQADSKQADTVRARLLDRASGEMTEIEAEALIGADGLHSVVRSRLHPQDGPLLWSGVRMWRGVTTLAEPFLTGHSAVIVRDGDVEIIAYPIGRGRINWVCQVRVGEPGPLAADAAWSSPGQLAQVLPYYQGWALGRLDVPGLLAGAEEVLEYPMVDREPLAAWGRGRVTLLGDAAHPMYPIGANGASQAIVDARVLAYELAGVAGAAEVPTGLARYESARREATGAVVLASRAMYRDGGHTAAELARVSAAYRSATGSEVEVLNNRASLSRSTVQAP